MDKNIFSSIIGSNKAKTFVYRVHDEPDPEKLNTFARFVSKLGYNLKLNNREDVVNSYNQLFKDIEGSTLLTALDKKGFAIASGSACSSVNKEPSHVLLAMGIDEDLARGALRISFGQKNSVTEVKDFIDALKKELQTLKQLTAIAA